MSDKYLEELNSSQREAVTYNDGPSLVIAGAGSGKTRVLTYKIAYLLEQGFAPYNILALTFTNKASREMKERIAQHVGETRSKYLWMGTFHSIFLRILRKESQLLNFTSNFTIYDDSDSKSLMRTIIKELQLDDKKYKANFVLSSISRAKNHLITAEDYATNQKLLNYDVSNNMPAIKDLYKIYSERCRQANAMDFDDILLYTYLLFKNNPSVLEAYIDQFHYVLVDEYQDTNFAQHSIVLQLTERRRRVCVVGDDAQSIYSFRGANIDNILYFTKVYEEAKLFKLEQNYRSTQTIVGAANSLIKKNKSQIPKNVFSKQEVGNLIEVFESVSDVDEANIVINKIQNIRRENNDSYDDFAILYRTNAQSRSFEEVLRKRSIPYKIYGGLSFYQRKEVKDVISYFRLIINPSDEEAFKRIINYPKRGIGATTVDKIAVAAHHSGVSFWEVINEPLTYGLELNKGALSKLQKFTDIISPFIEQLQTQDAYHLGREIIKASGMVQEFDKEFTPENLSRKENIDELVNAMSLFCQTRVEEGSPNVYLPDYLSEVALLTDQDSNADEDSEKVTLMTIHSAKGLEFKNVMIVGLEDGLFPSERSLVSSRALEEERRLFYVAITRAEKNCCISYAKCRFRFGQMERSSPSRFIRDVDEEFLKLPYKGHLSAEIQKRSQDFRQENSKVRTTPSVNSNASSRATSSAEFPRRNLRRIAPAASAAPQSRSSLNGLSIGTKIEHQRFGIGTVTRLEGSDENAKATINFQNAGEKSLLLKFAKFKVVD